MTEQVCDREGHDDRPATAQLVYWGQGPTLGAALCREDATCVDPGCGELGVIMDAEYEEPWCQPHADQFREETVSGPEIVLFDSDRHREVLAEVGAA